MPIGLNDLPWLLRASPAPASPAGPFSDEDTEDEDDERGDEGGHGVKRVMGALAFMVVLSVVIPAAQGHGTCTAQAKPLQRSTTQIVYTGVFDCVNTVHDSLGINVYLQRRPPGGSWSIIDIVTGTAIYSTRVVGQEIHAGEDCNKEYRARVASANASPGGHSGTNNGPVSQSYC